MQPAYSAPAADVGLFGAREFRHNPEASRLLPHITHTGEFHLERLTNLLKVRYGRTFESAGSESNDALQNLISYAARIQDQDVQRELLLFYLNCSPVIQDFLRSETRLGDGNFPFG